ncbi:MAG: O-antigen ligase family protein [Hyphomonadaceae bacterium]|nr:O-antigen ligase family protein [Clostridia bacterium]
MKQVKRIDSQINILGMLFSGVLFLGILFQGLYFPTQYLLATTILLLMVIVALVKNRQKIQVDVYMLLSAVFCIIYCTDSIIVAADRYGAMLESVKIIAFFTVVFLSKSFIKDLASILRAFYRACLTMNFIGLLCYFHIFYVNDGVLRAKRYFRMQSLLQYANTTAILMAIGFVLTLYYIDFEKTVRAQTKFYLYAFLFLVGLLLTASKGAIAIFLLVMLVFLLLLKDLEKTLKVFILSAFAVPTAIAILWVTANGNLMLGAIILMVGTLLACCACIFSDRLQAKVKKGAILSVIALGSASGLGFVIVFWQKVTAISIYLTFVERAEYMSDALHLLATRPLTGIGGGNWGAMQYSIQSFNYAVQYIHNSVLQIFVDCGIIGGLLFVAIIVLFYHDYIKQYRREKDSLSLYVLAVVSLLLIHTSIDIDLNYPALLMVFAVLITSSTRERKPMLTVSSMYFIIGFSIICIGVGSLLFGQIAHNRAQVLTNQGHFEEAFAICQTNDFFMPMSSQNNMQKAVNLFKQSGDYQGAVAYIGIAQKYNPYESKNYVELYHFALQNKDYDTAFQTCVKLTELQRWKWENYDNALETLEKMKQTDKTLYEKYVLQGQVLIDKRAQIMTYLNTRKPY